MWFLRLWIIGVFSALLSTTAQGETFFAGSTVVILVGLPGDVSSEKSYGDETRRLLELLNTSGKTPNQVMLLSGVLPPTDFKPSYSLQILPNDRATFLSLPEKLKAAANTCVFVVFGHGGTQGSTAVFHVPGVRLAPDDFATVAAAETSSTWLLFFPGCSNFAKALQAPKRTLLATEGDDKSFTEDPISFALFLNTLAKENDLTKLSQTWGAATRDWYETRQLARTEDPALWIDAQPPVKLAQVGQSDPGATTPMANTVPFVTNNAIHFPPDQPPPDPVWATIVPADPTKYPQSDAVSLLRNVSYILDDNDGVTEEEETFLQILTQEGKRYGDFQFTFSPPDEDLEFLACEVRLPNGQIERLDPDNIRDANKPTPDEYDLEKIKIFSFPRLQPGAIIRIHLQRTWQRFPMPHVSEEVPLASEIPTVAAKVEVRLPEKAAFHFKLLNQAAQDPVLGKTGYSSLYRWEFHDLPAVLTEPLSPPEQTPTLVVSTFPDWSSFSDWYIRLIRDSNQPEPELTKQAQDLIVGAKDDEEKIEHITRFVTNFRYVSVPLGVNSFRPHSALHVWQNRYGDCKDKANLLVTLLTAVGFKTHLVLVPRFSQAYPDLPGFAFNHAIAEVELPGKTLWLDSTDDVCRFGFLPPGDPGRDVLVVDSKVDALTTLPVSAAKDNLLTLESTVDLTKDADRATPVAINAESTGFADYLLRALAQSAGPHQVLPLLSGRFSTTSGTFIPAQQKGTPVDDLAQGFQWKASGTWDGLISRLPQSSTELLRLPGWIPQDWRIALLPRSNPLHLNDGYPTEIVQTWHIHLPAGCTGLKLPAPESDAGPQLNWNLAWKNSGPSEVAATLDLILSAADLDQKETGGFQASCHHLQEILQDGLSYQHP